MSLSEDQAKREQQTSADPKPVCPHCGADPFVISSRPGQVGILNIIMLFCGNPDCRKVFNVEIVGVQRSSITIPN